MNNKTKVIITGINGFVGYYLSDYLKKTYDCKIYGLGNVVTDLDNYHKIDLCNLVELENFIKKTTPDYIFHLAAQSSVKLSWDKPNETINNNITSTINLLECIKKYSPKTRILLIGSSEEYGKTFEINSSPTEEEKCMPENPYAISKVAQNQLGTLYAKAYNLFIVMTRSFNHMGPGQSELFVLSDFCKQVVEIKYGLKKNIIYVGNLEAKRDFTDVRDIVKAYASLIISGQSGQTYNVGSGKLYKISALLDKIVKIANCDINIEIDNQKYRPIEIKEACANITKINSDIKWNPDIELDQTINDTILYWEKKLNR